MDNYGWSLFIGKIMITHCVLSPPVSTLRTGTHCVTWSYIPAPAIHLQAGRADVWISQDHEIKYTTPHHTTPHWAKTFFRIKKDIRMVITNSVICPDIKINRFYFLITFIQPNQIWISRNEDNSVFLSTFSVLRITLRDCYSWHSTLQDTSDQPKIGGKWRVEQIVKE